jgi:general secretion pathway protein G
MAIEGKRFVWIFLGAIVVVVAVTSSLAPRYGRMSVAHAGARQVRVALEVYHSDNGFYPTTEQGLRALVAAATAPPVPAAFRDGAYLKDDQLDDAWGNPFQYRQPGVHNPESFDVWTWGADGRPGGEGIDADFGNFGATLESES